MGSVAGILLQQPKIIFPCPEASTNHHALLSQFQRVIRHPALCLKSRLAGRYFQQQYLETTEVDPLALLNSAALEKYIDTACR